MDGTYGNPIARSQSPMTPATPSTPAGQYQVNIGRTKTKKWVEAKTQSYDGGGWGDDDEEESDEQDPTPPMPPPPTKYSPRLASESRGPFAPPQPSAASSALPNVPRTASPLSAHTAQSSPAARGGSPALPDPSATGATGEFSRNLSVQTQNLARTEASGTNDSTHGQQQRPDGNNNDHGGAQGVSLHDTKQSPDVPPAASAGAGPAIGNPLDIDRGKSSASPQIPAVSRMSDFGADMFTSQFSKPADEPAKQDSQPAAGIQKPASPAPESSKPSEGVDPQRPALPGGWVTETPSLPDVGPSETGARQAEDASDSRSTGSDGRRNDQQALPPLQTGAARSNTSTPGPVESSLANEDAAQHPVHESTSPRSDITDIPPTQPLQPRKPDYSPADYDLQPIHRQITQSTVTYSPIKQESDMLRDEIMRTLSPTKEDAPDNKPPAPERKDTQETQASSYSLGVYDAYLAVSSGPNDATTPAVDATIPVEGAVSPPAGLVDSEAFGIPSPDAQGEPKLLETVPEAETESRQRFSWEMNKPAGPGAAAQPAPSSTVPAAHSPASEKSDATTKDGPAAQVGAPDVTSAGSPAVSSGATVPMVIVPPGATDKTAFQEPPSPVSAMSLQREGSNRSTLPEDHTPTVTSPTGLSAPGQAVPPPPSAPTGATNQAQLPSFKDIMGMPTAAERIEKYDETRAAFASMDSGLEDWMTKLKAQHPEHADQTASFYGASGQPQGPGSSAGATGAGAQTSSQQQQQQQPQPQPYYQQYLNATSPVMNAPPPQRNRIGSLPAQLQGATSTFGSSSNQIGNKGKEFMQSAGKMGKGLFNKGKSKLRGTGDKVFH
jgi:serine/arginine repetitive matrix protein 2